MSRRHDVATDRSVCTGEFLWKSLWLQQNFVAATSRTNSVWLDFLRLIAATKFCCGDKDFHKNSPVHTKRFVVATCRLTVLLQLVARPVHMEWSVAATSCCNLSPSVYRPLEVTIDKHLSFDVHVEELCNKLSQRIAVLRKIRRFIRTEQRILYYNAIIKQVMLYGSAIWSNCSADNLTGLKLQKRAARVILGADTRSNSVNLFNKIKSGWLPFYDKAKVNKCSLVLKRLQGNCPSYMYDLLKCNADLHTRSGRYSALNLVCPRYNRESEGGRTFSVSATRLWNSLPINLKKKRNMCSLI